MLPGPGTPGQSCSPVLILSPHLRLPGVPPVAGPLAAGTSSPLLSLPSAARAGAQHRSLLTATQMPGQDAGSLHRSGREEGSSADHLCWTVRGKLPPVQ